MALNVDVVLLARKQARLAEKNVALWPLTTRSPLTIHRRGVGKASPHRPPCERRTWLGFALASQHARSRDRKGACHAHTPPSSYPVFSESTDCNILRPQIGRDYPLNLSISLSGGKETNQDSLSNGE